MAYADPKIAIAAVVVVATAGLAASLLVSGCPGPGCALGCNSDDAYLTLPDTPDAQLQRVVT